MGCFFGCFRTKDSNSNLIAPHEHRVSGSKNALSSLFLSDDELDGHGNRVPRQSEAKQHKDEVKLVKTFGTLLETPTEIQKPSEKWKDIPAQSGEEKSSTKLKHEKQSGESPVSGSGSLMGSPSSQQLNQSELAGSVTELLPSLGDVSLAHMNDAISGKVSEDRLQNGQAVLQSVENTPTSKELEDQSTSDHLREPLKINDEGTLIATQNIEKKYSAGNDMVDEGSLSSWFKPISALQNSNNKQFDSIYAETVHLGKSPEDRPILGMVATYWKDDEPSDTPPKLRDGNGIPNSTNKYKEDQKVSFHTTPFEERLEKALSEVTSTSHSQRKPISGTSPLKFHETEESDTASSQLRSDES